MEHSWLFGSSPREPQLDVLGAPITAGIPDIFNDDEVVQIRGDDRDVVIKGYGDVGTGNNVTHIIWGWFGTDVDNRIEIARYNNLETIATEGKYVHPISNAGLKYSYIGVQQTVGGGVVGDMFWEFKRG